MMVNRIALDFGLAVALFIGAAFWRAASFGHHVPPVALACFAAVVGTFGWVVYRYPMLLHVPDVAAIIVLGLGPLFLASALRKSGD